ncbi:MAG: Ig-like domain-containing protein, partial [Hyphomicrobium sp.]
ITQFTVDGVTGTFTAGSPASIPNVGTLTINIDGSYTFVPAANFNGPVPVATYTVSDSNGGFDTGTLTLAVTAVNDAPVAADVSQTTTEDTPVSGTLTATDVDSSTLTFTKATDPSHGTVVVNPNGTYTYTPSPNYNGPDSFTYTVSDGNGGSVTHTVTINVAGFNDPPVAVDDTAEGAEDSIITGDVTPGTPGQDSDPEGNTLLVVDADGNALNGLTPVSGPSNGTVVLNANGTFTYTPNANYHGTDSFTYRISDGMGGFAEATVTLTINPVNDAPTATNGSLTTPEDTVFSGTLPVATDVDGDDLTYAAGTNPAHGTVVVYANGTYTYTPAPNYSGSDTFTYTVSDGKGAVISHAITVMVTPVNDAPVAVDVSKVTAEDTPVSGILTATDIDGDTLTFLKASDPANGTVVVNANGTYTYTPNANYVGGDSFTYTVSDGKGGSVTKTVAITVTPVNDAPVAQNVSTITPEETPVSGVLTATDIDGGALTFTKASNPAHGTVVVNANGTYTYTPAPNYNGPDSFTYTVSDGNGGTVTRTVAITVTPLNDIPVVSEIKAPPSVDGGKVTFDVSKVVVDVDGDALTYSATGLPPGLSINPTSGVITGTLPKDASQSGPYTVTLTVDDGKGGVVTKTFTWPVTNPAPSATDDSAFVKAGEATTVNVLANDRDPDGDALTVTKAQAANGQVQILADGSIKYIPTAGFVGTDRITYVVSDGNGGFAIASVTISVAEDGYDEKTTEFGFEGTETPFENGINGSGTGTSAGITAEGAVVDAVFDIGMLRSLAGQLGESGAVLAAANGVRSLDGVARMTTTGVVVDTIRAERAREMMFSAGLNGIDQQVGFDGLAGFSMRNNVPGNLGGLSAREQVVIESLVRKDTLIIQISNTLESGSRQIIDYRIMQIDGKPLPQWLDRAGKDLLIGRRDVGTEVLMLKVEAVYSDGSVIVQEVQIDTATGEIQPVIVANRDVPAPPMFGDQLQAPSQLTIDQIEGLGVAISR